MTRAEFARTVDSVVAQPEFRNALWGVLVVDPASGDTVFSLDAGKLFLPASNMKLVTASVALARLGAGFRYVTTLAARGPVTDGTLHGDLLVYGRGDPTVSDSAVGDAMAPLRAMADSLSAAGIRRITGRLAVGADVFPGPTLGFGWSWDDLGESYGAPVDELLFNDGYALVHVRAGSVPGAAVTAATSPARDYPAVRVEARTVSRDAAALPAGDALRAVVDTLSGTVDVLGAIGAGDTATLVVPFTDPDGAYLAALLEALHDRGIAVDGQPADTTGPVDTLVRMRSEPLGGLLPAVLKPSQNQMAEMLLRTVALQETGIGVADSAFRVERDQLVAWGAPDDGFVLRDGSGLSRYDYLSPETIVRVLAAMAASPDSAAFIAALPVAGVDGTLERRMRGTAAEGNVRAKTGSLAGARSLSGYATTADGRRVVFSALCNNFSVSGGRVTEALDAIAVGLASLRLR
ncbi:MAG: D-alanyl-D-alanine carboxypeptidase/D-alanyl-D-alanine-endopeptidase [Gemmatimonadota bacterium]|nr:D-alanyl-D-alanine carboxypeptidase/D-alanyl-D-alanine-endopeptidase [Gemmatimonadota bacterium]